MFNGYEEILGKLFKDSEVAGGIGDLLGGFQDSNNTGNGGALDLESYRQNAFQGYNFKHGGLTNAPTYPNGGLSSDELASRQESPAEKVMGELGLDIGTYRKYRDLVINHETGGTFDPKQKQVGGGPGRGLFQFGADSAKTAAKRLKTYFKNKKLPVPDFLDNVDDATGLSPKEQELLFAGQMMDKVTDGNGGFKVRLNKTFQRDKWDENDFADAWINNHNKTQGVERADRISKFKSDSKVIFEKAGDITQKSTQITPFVDEAALTEEGFDHMDFINNPDKAFLGKLIKEIGKGAKRFIKKPLKTLGQGLGELGKGFADTSLSLIGAGDVINNSYLDRDKTLGDIANVTGTVARAGLDFVVPGAGTALGAAGGALNGVALNNQAGKQAQQGQMNFNNSASGGMAELMGILGGGFTGMGAGGQGQDPMALLSSLFGGKMENGGIINTIPEGLEGLQAEKYRGNLEKIILPDGMIADTNATTSHEKMDDDEITDVLPGGSYVASARPDMKISTDTLRDIVFGYKSLPYEEHAKGIVPEKITAGDIIPKKVKKILPSEYAELIQKTFPVFDHDDMFTNAANTENMASRAPYLKVLVELGEQKRKELENPVGQFKYGGYIKPRKAFGGAAIGAGLGVAGSLLSGIGGISNINAQKKELQAQQAQLAALTGQLQGLNNQSVGVGIAGQLAQDTSRKDLDLNFSRMENFNTGTPQSFIDAQAAPNVDVASLIDRLGDRGGIAALANVNATSSQNRNAAAQQAYQNQQGQDYNIANLLTQGENHETEFNRNLRDQETNARNNVFNNIAGQVQGGLQTDASLRTQNFNVSTELGSQLAGLQGQGLAAAGNALGSMGGVFASSEDALSGLFSGGTPAPTGATQAGPTNTMTRDQIVGMFPQNQINVPPPTNPGFSGLSQLPDLNSRFFPTNLFGNNNNLFPTSLFN